MRLLKSQIEQKTGSGFATLLPEEPEDMVHCRPPTVAKLSLI